MIDAVGEADRRMDGMVLLGAEINFARTKPEIVRSSIDWEAVKHKTKHCSVALRVAPFTGPFRADDEPARIIVDLAKQLIEEARAQAIVLEEFQFDFDCSRKNLDGYRTWLRALTPAVHPTPLVITTLPAWIDDANFRSLVRERDGYALQVHSVPISNAQPGTLCDARLARRWIKQAAKLGVPFSVALPTYRCSAGYAANGRLLSVAMDSVQPSWPPGTRVLEFSSNADEIGRLVGDLKESRPSNLKELLWYRVPIATEMRNWRWPTLSAVMAGHGPEHNVKISIEGENPIDLSVINAGEADEEVTESIIASWSDAGLTASDALMGWSVRSERNRAIFSAATSNAPRLPPGAERRIGWLRFDRPTTLRTQFSN